MTMWMPNSSANRRHHHQRHHALLHGLGAQELAAKPDHHQQRHQVEPVAAGSKSGLPPILAAELAKGDQRAGEGDRADQDADVDLHLVDDLFRALQLDGGIDIAGKPHQAGRQAHQAVHERNQLGHLRHLDDLGGIEANAAATASAHDPGHATRADARAKHGGQHGQRHADHAEQAAPARGFRAWRARPG